jgi:oligopeptide transport system permease protein
MSRATGFWGQVRAKLARDRRAWAGGAMVGLVCLGAIAAPLLATHGEGAQDVAALLQSPSWAHWMGTDELGRDLWSRLLFGARVSMTVALATSALAMLLGTLLGAISGWRGGRLDNLLMRLVDVIYAFPDLLLIIIISVLVGQNVGGIVLSLSLVSWVTVARVVRGEVMSIKERPFVEAARALGFGPWRILFREILPHTLAPILVTLTFRIPSVILAESTLSFLGLGLQPPASSWGVLAAAGWTALAFHPHLILAPAAAIFVTILGFNLLGDALRDAMEV